MALIPNKLVSLATRSSVCVLLLGLGGAIFLALTSTKPAPAVRSEIRRPKVPVFAAEQVPVRRQWQGFGTAEAMDSADVPARVTATVVEIPQGVLAGRDIEAGQLLVRLDDSDFVREVEIAAQRIAEIDARLDQIEVDRQSLSQQLALGEQELSILRDERDRTRELLDQGAANQTDLNRTSVAVITAEASLVGTRQSLQSLGPNRASLSAQRASLESSLQLAKLNQQRCRIESPLGGVIEAVDVEVGENLREGDRVASVVSLEHMEVPLRLPAASRSSIRVGDEALIVSARSGDEQWRGRVARIAPINEESTRTLAVYVEIDQAPAAEPLLVPGMFTYGTVTSGEPTAGWVVPRRSIQNGRIMLVRDGVITSSQVQVEFHMEQSFPGLGLPDTQWAAINCTLARGDLVVISPSQKLLDGEPVEPSLTPAAPTAMHKQENRP